jgi:hypothetical protein
MNKRIYERRFWCPLGIDEFVCKACDEMRDEKFSRSVGICYDLIGSLR